MHGMGNQVADAVEHRAMPGQPGKPLERFGHDGHRKVPAAERRARVAGVLGAVVVDLEHGRREGAEPGLRASPRRSQAAVLIGTARPCAARGPDPGASANSRKSPIPPHTLKLTQVSVGKWNATYQLATAMKAKKPDP